MKFFNILLLTFCLIFTVACEEQPGSVSSKAAVSETLEPSESDVSSYHEYKQNVTRFRYLFAGFDLHRKQIIYSFIEIPFVPTYTADDTCMFMLYHPTRSRQSLDGANGSGEFFSRCMWAGGYRESVSVELFNQLESIYGAP